jgi:hypothetical protein
VGASQSSLFSFSPAFSWGGGGGFLGAKDWAWTAPDEMKMQAAIQAIVEIAFFIPRTPL